MKRFKKRKSATIGFANEAFLGLLSSLTGISPVGVLGRETPLDLSSLEAARGSLLLREVFSKYDDGEPSPSKEETTWKRFHDAERQCETANQYIYWQGNLERQNFWKLVRARVANVLGRFDWDECARYFAFGPGATTRLTRKESFAAYKYSGIPESTPGNAALARCAIAYLPIWKQIVLSAGESPEDDLVKIVPGNSVIAVPKNFKTDRTIAKEPCMNIYVQKGIGRAIRKRLRRVGVDLDDQTRNQRAAREGSLTGQLATIDLSMASDTVARELIRWLLPTEWCIALEQTRSPCGVLPSGEVIQYQKFSSMGNGYTFELETLIFWAIAQECACPGNIWEKDPSICVYGDDIVAPTHCAAYICERLEEVGFTPNDDKTWITGPYRESCGKHYYLGVEITPFYVKKPVRSLDRLFLVHNQLFRWLSRREVVTGPVAALTQLRSLAPAKWREPRLPDGYGDGAFIGPVDELHLDSHPYGWEFWQVKALSRSQAELSVDLPDGQLIASLQASVGTRHLLSEAVQRKLKRRRPRESFDILEGTSGIPVRVGGYREINILIPRHPRA